MKLVTDKFDSPLLPNRSFLYNERLFKKGSVQTVAPRLSDLHPSDRIGESSTCKLCLSDQEPSDRIAELSTCIVNMLATILGSGLLSLPYAMAGTGLWMGIFVFSFFMIISSISLLNLSKAVEVYSGYCDFMVLAKDNLPNKVYWLVDFIVLINCFGCCTGLLIVMSTLMPKVVEAFLTFDNEWALNRQLWCAICAGFLLPPVFLKNLEALKFTSFLVAIFVIYMGGVMIYYYAHRTQLGYAPEYEPVVHYWFPGDVAQFLKVFAIIANGFACSQNVPRVVKTLVNPTQMRLKMVFTTPTTICLLLYSVIACIGYLSFGEDVDSNVLRSYPTGLVLINIARLSITLALAGGYPVQLHPARNSLSVLLYNVPVDKLPFHRYFSISIAIWSATVGIAMITDSLGHVSTFIGALGAVPLTFIYPNWFWIKVSQKLGYHQTVWHAWLILILGVAFVPMSLSTAIYNMYLGKA